MDSKSSDWFVVFLSFVLCLDDATAGTQDCIGDLEAAGAGCLVDCGPTSALTGGWTQDGNASAETYELNLLDQMADGGLGLPEEELWLTGGEAWLNVTLLVVEARCGRDVDAPLNCRVGEGSCARNYCAYCTLVCAIARHML